MLTGMQPLLLFLTLLFTYAHTIKPPGYVEQQKADADPNPPKYEYGYNIVGDKGGEQGKQEQRDGIYASGRYFVQNKDARQDVQYFADDWGYHPAVEYANVGPHSKSSAKFALGHEAVVQLRNKENNLPQLEGLPDTGPLKKEGRNVQLTQTKPLTAEPENSQPNYQQPTVTVNPQPNYDPFKQQQQQQINLQQSQQIIQEQPQQIYQEQQQQQIIHQQPQQIYQEQQQQIIHEQPRQIIQEQQQIIHEQPRQIIQEQQQQQIIHDQPQQIIQEQQQIIHDQPRQIIQEQQQIIHDQPQQIIQEQQQQQIIHEQPQQIVQEQQQIIQKQPQQQIVLEQQNTVYEQQQKEQPHEQQLIYEQQPFAYKQQPYLQAQQLVVQHVQQPIENLIFPQSTPSPIDDGKSVLLQQQEQQNIVLLGQKNVNQEAEEQANAFTSQQFGLRYQIKKPNKLIASTQHLVTGQDVLDINHAAAGVSTTAVYEDFGIKSTPCSTLTEVTGSESNFKEQPIVAAEVENNIVSTTGSIYREQEQFISTTASTIGDLSTTFESSTPTPTIVVTPRPISPTYVTPVSAGLESTEHYDEKYNLNKQNVQIEVQKTIPYYLGKYDYPSGYGNTNHSLVEQRVKNDLELGNTLFYFPGQLVPPSPVTEVNNHVNIQQLPSPTIENQFVDLDQQVAQGYQHQVFLQQQQPKVIHQPYPVRVPVHVVKQVSVPVTVEKVVEKPVHITKIVEKPVAVPQPYPVERVVEKPVHVPVQITKYIDRPYPVEVRVPYPQPYPVEKIVEKIVKQPYPVEVRVPVHIDRIVEKKVPVPHYIEKQVPVEKIVERKVPQYVDRPYPVHIQVPVPTPVAVPVDRIIERKIPVPQYIEKQVPVEKIVEKPVPQYIDRPYPVPQPYYVRVEVPRRYLGTFPVKFIQRPYSIWPVQNNNEWNYDLNSNLNAQAQRIQQNLNSQVQARYNENHSFSNTNVKAAEQSASDGYHYPNPYSYAPQNSFYLPPKQELVVNKEYLPPLTHNCDHGSANGNDNYIGLSPPKVEQKNSRKYRSPRSNFNDKSIKMEYGFKPPLVPSLEIDEYGQPVEKEEK